VFDPFYRVLGSEEVGSGLGLSIVRSIADRMGAQVDLGYADDGAQTGLRVTLRFPAAPPFGLNRS
jgi:two-component system OmpR family sensor kinase